jgi:long-chain acyl-CoA synthetase
MTGSTDTGFNLAQLLLRSARAFSGAPALALGGQLVASYAELAERTARLAGGLAGSLGLRCGDRVALVMRNCPQYVELLFACWQAGLIAVPVNAKLHPKELEYILAHSGSRACFASADHGASVAASGTRAAIVEVDSADWKKLHDNDALPVCETNGGDAAWLFYTSGTTGRPKGVTLSHRNLLVMTLCYFADVDAIATGDSIVHAAPMSHGSGLYILPHIARGAVQVAPESGGFEPEEIVGLWKSWPRATLFAAPTMVKRLTKHAIACGAPSEGLKTIVYGGGPMYLTDCQDALACFGGRLVQIYGQGESPMTITALSGAAHADTSHPRYLERLGSVGIAQTAVEVRIVDRDDSPLPPGETGEVLVRGDVVMRGYWENPAASAETLRNGWLHTGDLGCLDADGFLTLRDRSKDVIISGGSNIYPREVEEVLLRHPLISEASVVGRSDDEWGESVVAFVVGRNARGKDEPAAGNADQALARNADEAALREELDRLCLANIARFKRPREYLFVPELPKNSAGKVLKGELRKLLAAC